LTDGAGAPTAAPALAQLILGGKERLFYRATRPAEHQVEAKFGVDPKPAEPEPISLVQPSRPGASSAGGGMSQSLT
jgi:hypothetical protein